MTVSWSSDPYVPYLLTTSILSLLAWSRVLCLERARTKAGHGLLPNERAFPEPRAL